MAISDGDGLVVITDDERPLDLSHLLDGLVIDDTPPELAAATAPLAFPELPHEWRALLEWAAVRVDFDGVIESLPPGITRLAGLLNFPLRSETIRDFAVFKLAQKISEDPEGSRDAAIALMRTTAAHLDITAEELGLAGHGADAG